MDALPLEDSITARLVVTDKGDSQREKITNLTGPGTATVAEVVVSMDATSFEGSVGKVWSPRPGCMDACHISHHTDRGKAKLKMVVPDLNKFEVHTNQTNCSECQDETEFLLGKKPEWQTSPLS